jgi:Fe-S-cluster-containing dehydrogenase component
MTYRITSQCIECHRCESICPTGAITQYEQQYQINPERCNDCVGHYSVPQCWAACPTDGGCVPSLATLARSPLAQPFHPSVTDDYWDRWFETYERMVSRLKANPSPRYWHSWFETYSQALSKQLRISQPLNNLHPPAGANA